MKAASDLHNELVSMNIRAGTGRDTKETNIMKSYKEYEET